ncbi:uncharacterized protein LOC141831774 [Curcuma longa]|uniref:uncharacterized protein LOC141831774 n=1 Tax=Curcuma longa TaxID=136217 RepID=UPI003D9F8074
MGCGGSKQQDVATGNTVTRGLLRRSSSVAKGKRSEEKGADAIKVSDPAAVEDAKKAPADGEPQLASKGSSSEEYFSSRREPDSLVDAVEGGAEVAAVSLPGEHVDANANAKAGEDKETSAVPELEKEEEKKDKEETTANNEEEEEEEEEEGKSVGQLSADFKEALSLDEKEAEAAAMEKEDTQAATTTAEEKKNSGESKTSS